MGIGIYMTEAFDFTSLNLKSDKFGSITIDSTGVPDDINLFEIELIRIIEHVKDKKLIWIELSLEQSHCIPLLAKHDFVFHHCNERDITMVKKLIEDSTIPTALNHTLGVGAVVIDGNNLLVVKDSVWQKYKLPGGYIDDSESIAAALQREVSEETGVRIEPESIVSLAHSTHAQFGKSNLYVVCRAKALSRTIHIADPQEIIEAVWMDIDEYLDREDVHIYNKDIVKAAMKNSGLALERHQYFADRANLHEYYF